MGIILRKNSCFSHIGMIQTKNQYVTLQRKAAKISQTPRGSTVNKIAPQWTISWSYNKTKKVLKLI
jgi:hypothetical protein